MYADSTVSNKNKTLDSVSKKSFSKISFSINICAEEGFRMWPSQTNWKNKCKKFEMTTTQKNSPHNPFSTCVHTKTFQ